MSFHAVRQSATPVVCKESNLALLATTSVNEQSLTASVDGIGVEPISLRRCTSAVFQPSKLTVRKTADASQRRRCIRTLIWNCT